MDASTTHISGPLRKLALLVLVLLRKLRTLSWPPSPRVVLLFGAPAVGLVATLVGAQSWLGWRRQTLEPLEQQWLAAEQDKRRKLLVDLLHADQSQQICAERLLDACEELRKCSQEEGLLQRGYQAAGRAVAREMEEAELEDLADLMEQGEELMQLMSSHSQALKDSLLTASQRRRTHHRTQLHKVWSLVCRVRNQVPFVLLSSGLSMLCGALISSRMHYQSQVVDLVQALASKRSASAPLTQMIGAMLTMQVASGLVEQLREKSVEVGQWRLVHQLKAQVYGAILAQDMHWFDCSESHELQELVDSCGSVCNELLLIPSSCFEALTHIVCSVLLLYRRSPRLTCAAAGLLCAQHAVLQLVHGAEEWLQARTFEPDLTDRHRRWHSTLSARMLRTVRCFGREPEEIHQFEQQLKSDQRLQSKESAVWRSFKVITELIEHGTEVLLLWVAGSMVATNQLELGGLVSFVYMAQSTFQMVRHFHARNAMLLETVFEPAARIVDILDRTPTIGLHRPALAQMPAPEAISWQLCFRDVSFAYASRPAAKVLDGVSFDVPAGSMLGVLGPTGSGKSTLMALVQRLYDPVQGQVLLDGKDLKQYNPLWLRHQIGAVSQDLVLFEASIRDNVLYGCRRTQVSDQEIYAALRVAGFDQLLTHRERFPEGINTLAGEAGVLLSGGERQRVGIARALLKDPRLLLLDEATSALDERTQATVQRSLEQLMRGRTTIVVAHRLSTLQRASQLICLDKGRICEQGTAEQLLAAGGMYSEFVLSSTAGSTKGGTVQNE